MIAEIIGPGGKVHYRRPENDPLVDEARKTPGYSVRLVETREEKKQQEFVAAASAMMAARAIVNR